MEWIAALGVAFGATYAVAMPLRTVRYPKLFWSTFAIAYVATVLAFYTLQIPVDMQAVAGIGGLILGVALTLIRKKTVKLEEDYEKTRRQRGEKIYH